MEIVGIALGVFLTAWEWLAGKAASLGAWGHEPLTGGWAFVGLFAIWTMHLTTRQKVAALSRRVEAVQSLLVQVEYHSRRGG